MPVSSSSRPATGGSARSGGWRLVLMAALVLGLVMLCAGALVARASHHTAASVTAQAERTPQGAKIALRGEGWPARASLEISASPPPGGQGALDLGTAQSNADGAFRASKLSPCTTSDSTLARGRITITVRTADAAVRAEASVPAGVWVCAPE